MSINDKNTWVQDIANRAKCKVSDVESILIARNIQASTLALPPKRLMLKRIEFSGVKVDVPNAGDFKFTWENLDAKLWAMMSERNFRGKSSIIEVVRWLLRGRASDNFQVDVRSWISTALLNFELDDKMYEVRLEDAAHVKGKLVFIENSDKEIAEFNSDDEFEAVMSNFFMREFSLDTITIWNNSGKELVGKPVIHDWPALSGALFIGTDYSSLLGDLGVIPGLNQRMIQMYLGLPWVPTLITVKAIQGSLENETKIAVTKVESSARKERLDFIKNQLEKKRLELEATPSDEDIRANLDSKTQQLVKSKLEERKLIDLVSNLKVGVSEAEKTLLEDRRALQAHSDDIYSGAIFRKLEPSCCPRCDKKISEERHQQELESHACSVCGDKIETDIDPDEITLALKNAIRASQEAVDEGKKELKSVEEQIRSYEAQQHSINLDLDTLTSNLMSFDIRNKIQLEISILEARLEELNFETNNLSSQSQIHTDEIRILKAIYDETHLRVKTKQESLLEEVSKNITNYAQKFGMHALTSARLNGAFNLLLDKGGQQTSYSKVTLGERLRLKLSTVLAMIKVAEKYGLGRHPGLLMIDSFGAQEITAQDREAIITGLESISQEFSHIQIFITAIHSSEIIGHIPSERTLVAHGEDYLW